MNRLIREIYYMPAQTMKRRKTGICSSIKRRAGFEEGKELCKNI